MLEGARLPTFSARFDLHTNALQVGANWPTWFCNWPTTCVYWPTICGSAESRINTGVIPCLTTIPTIFQEH